MQLRQEIKEVDYRPQQHTCGNRCAKLRKENMSDFQFYLIIATIYVVNHEESKLKLFFAGLFFILATLAKVNNL